MFPSARTLLIALLTAGLAGSALARGGGHGGGGRGGGGGHFRGPGTVYRGGFVGGIRAPLFFGAYAAYPYYYPAAYPPSGIVSQPLPPGYMEQVPPAITDQPSTEYWYYCPPAQAYFPYVQQCTENWQQIIPQTPAPPPASAPTQP